jgi:hypothetical protein
MVNIYDADTNASLGAITDAQLQFLIDQLEEESSTDQDYWINAEEVDVLETDGADPDLVAFLRKALGDRREMTIRWRQG